MASRGRLSKQSVEGINSLFSNLDVKALNSFINKLNELMEIKQKDVELTKENTEALREQEEQVKRLTQRQQEYIAEQKRINELKQAGGTAKMFEIEEEHYKKLKKEIQGLLELQKNVGLSPDQEKKLKSLEQKLSNTKTRKDTLENKLISNLNNPNATPKERSESIKFALGQKFKEAEETTNPIEAKIGNLTTQVGNSVSAAVVKAMPGGQMLSTLKTISDTALKIHDTLGSSVDAVMNMFTTYQGRTDARLQGSGLSFNGLVNNLNQTLYGSAYFKSTDYLSNLNKLTEQGIAYNLEQRALIETIGNKLVTTFQASDEKLARLIRIQQADMTYSQLGVEAKLTQLLNSVFKDTSYLSGEYDSVLQTIEEATSTMNRDNATSFNYAVQKWLGALYSVGMSTSGVSTIAQGLNYLASGDVTSLTGNTSLNTLMAMSASKAGLSYSELLTSGLNAVDVDELMESMIYYLKDIAENTGNQVTKKAYTNVFGLSMSDLRSVENLDVTDINAVSESDITYATAISEYKNQLGQLGNRTTIAEKVNNVIDNILYNFGASVADSDTQYLLWKSTDLLQEVAEQFAGEESGTGLLSTVVSFISGIGSSISLAWQLVENIADAGASIIQQFANADDYGFAWSEYNDRGEDYVGALGAAKEALADMATGISYSGEVATIATSLFDKETVSLAQNANAITLSGSTIVSSDSIGAVRTVADVYAQLFDNKQSVRVSVSAVESMAYETLVKAIMTSGVNGEGKDNSILANTKKTNDLLEEKLNASTNDIAQAIRDKVVEVKWS